MKDSNQKWRDLFGNEWEYIAKLGSCFIDPEEKRNFWETIKENKMKDSHYSIYQDFPVSENAKVKARRECLEAVLGKKKTEESA